MKIQHLAIIFIMIMLPISMVITSYIQNQIDTISLQTTYNTRLQTATADSIKSFQLNTLNNKYSSLSDSKIRDIEAAISTFYNSLGTELGASGYSTEELQPYIPAIVYTMYDGYYIYGKYWNETIEAEDGSQGDYQYGLRPYIYYSCRYKTSENNNFVVNYTLDNNITVYGKVKGNYVTTTGALINPDMVNNIEYDEYEYTDAANNTYRVKYAKSLQYDSGDKKITIEPEILKEQVIFLTDKNGGITDVENPYIPEEYEYIVFSNRKVYKENNQDTYFWNTKNKKQEITDERTLAFAREMTKNGHLYSNSAVQYYADAKVFSQWVIDNIGKITQNDAVEADEVTKVMENQNETERFAIVTDDKPIFDVTRADNNPLLSSSTFNQNRMSVIRKTIQSNLSSAIANFGSMADYEFAMPILSEEDWESLANNITVASFMQGIPIGTKFYNNYCIITNDKNKEVVTTDSIYVITDDNSNNSYDLEDETHFSTCKDLIDNNKKVVAAYRNIDFERQSVVLSEGNERYFYPHSNLKDYECMITAAEIYDIDDLIAGQVRSYNKNNDIYEPNRVATNNLSSTNLRKIYLTALAREKYDLYRTNAYFSENIIRIVDGQEVIGY